MANDNNPNNTRRRASDILDHNPRPQQARQTQPSYSSNSSSSSDDSGGGGGWIIFLVICFLIGFFIASML
ncbi:MAG: hypothetical protein IKH26_13300 [Bacteroidaceae bacterium]|nr:hypothetical protein [Bacteroidaceae bacterium]